MDQAHKEVKIQIRTSDATLAGSYANNLVLHMNREEFILDFINIVPPHATLNSRVVVSPTHLKRMVGLLTQSLERYEKEFGELPSAPPTPPPTEFVQ